MRRVATLLVALTLLVLSLPASAAQPVVGMYSTLNNDFLEGRAAESWANAPANKSLDHVFNSQSWDGSVLGTEWEFQCGIGNTAVTANTVDGNGNGTITYQTNYAGGVFWLSKDGPWGDGVNDLTGTVNATSNTTTVQFFQGNPVTAVSNITSSGQFDGSNCQLSYVISNAAGLGDTDSAVKPAGYPDFLDTGCASGNRDRGSWGNIITITMQIDCDPTAAEPSTWGMLKQRYE